MRQKADLKNHSINSLNLIHQFLIIGYSTLKHIIMQNPFISEAERNNLIQFSRRLHTDPSIKEVIDKNKDGTTTNVDFHDEIPLRIYQKLLTYLDNQYREEAYKHGSNRGHYPLPSTFGLQALLEDAYREGPEGIIKKIDQYMIDQGKFNDRPIGSLTFYELAEYIPYLLENLKKRDLI